MPKPFRGTLPDITHPQSNEVLSDYLFNELTGSQLGDTFPSKRNGIIKGPTWVPRGLKFEGSNQWVDLDAHVGVVKDLDEATIILRVNMEGIDLVNLGGSGDVIAISIDSSNRFEIGFGSFTGSFADEAITIQQSIGGVTQVRASLRESVHNMQTILASGSHEFAITTSPAGNTWFFDGRPIVPSYAVGSASTPSITKIPTADTFRLGLRFDMAQDFKGIIERFKIYNRALFTGGLLRLSIDPYAEYEQPSPAKFFFIPAVVAEHVPVILRLNSSFAKTKILAGAITQNKSLTSILTKQLNLDSRRN